MKKFLSILSIVLAAMLVLGTVAFAENDGAKIIVGEASGKAGETVKIEVSVENNPGIALASLKVSYDAENLELISVTDGEIWGAQVHSPEFTNCPYTLFWSNPLITENIVENGVIATLEFKIAKKAKAKKYPVTISYDYEKGDIIDAALKSVKFEVEDGTITVRASSSGGGGGGSSSGGSSSDSGSTAEDEKDDAEEPETPTDLEKPETPEEPEAPAEQEEPVVNALTFDDVTENDWFRESVNYVVDKGLMNGVGDGKFAPGANLTRAMLVTILYRAETTPTVESASPFADVELGAYYADAVIWAKQNGIVNGVDENNFAPDANITREQVEAIIYRYSIYKGMEEAELSENLGFADAEQISGYAVSALNWTVSQNLIKGYEDNTVRPANNITRAEMSTILQRYLEK